MQKAASTKKAYKAPAPVKSVHSGKIMQASCSGSCGSAVSSGRTAKMRYVSRNEHD